MPLKSPQFAVSNGENKGMSAGNPLESSIYGDEEMSASDTKNLSQEELAKKVLSLSQEVLSLSQKLRAVSGENAQLKLELKKEKAAKTGATEGTGESGELSAAVLDLDEGEPPKDADQERAATLGSSLDGSLVSSADDGAGGIELQTPPGEPAAEEATPTHHKVESLEALEEVKGNMNPGDTVSVNKVDMTKDGKDYLVDMNKVQTVVKFLKAANDKGVGVTKLDLSQRRRYRANNALGVALFVEAMEVLARHLPKGLTSLNLSGNELGVDGLKVLAPLLPKGLTSLNLARNYFGDKGMKVLAPHLPKGLTKLDLHGNDFGVDGLKVLAPHLPQGLMSLDLASNNFMYAGIDGVKVLAPLLPKGLKNLDLRYNINEASDWEPLLRFFFREGLLSSNLVILGVEDSKTDPMLHEGTQRGWNVFGHRPFFIYFFKALGFQFSTQAAVVRWVVVLSCIAAFFLPLLFSTPNGGDIDDNEGGGDGSSQSSSSFIAVSLGEVCGGNTEALGDLFVDPVSGLMAVVVVAAAFVVYQVFATRLKKLAVYIVESLFSCSACSGIKDMLIDNTNGKVGKAMPTLDTGIDCALSKVQRSFFLFVHLQVLFFVLGDYFMWSNPVPFDSALCRSALVTTVIFYKPFIVSTFYCLNYLADATGWLLWHNPLTDSIVAVLLVLLLLWAVVAFAFSLPLLVCFFFFTLAFFVPPIAYFACFVTIKYSVGKTFFDPEGTETEGERAEAAAFGVILKRLVFYSFFACLVFGIALYPFYEGGGYVETVERVSAAVLPSLSLWSPEFALSFSWPRVSFPSQIGLALSIGALSLEYLLLAWQIVLARMYPLGYAFDGMYAEIKEDKKTGDGNGAVGTTV